MSEFEGFSTVHGLKTGDQRRGPGEHIVGIGDTTESIMSNEMIVYMECGRDAIAHQSFKRTCDPNEIKVWVDMVWEDHKKTCPFVHHHEWGPWLIGPYYPTHLVRRCACGEEEKREVEAAEEDEATRFINESKPLLFTILMDLATTLSAKLTKPQIIRLMRETIDEMERR